jgi:prevent-host-death family protein
MTMEHDHAQKPSTSVLSRSATVSKSEFKPRALAYLRRVEESGEALVITDHGKPVLRITPYSPTEEALAALRGCVRRLDLPTEPVAVDDWEALA